MTLFCSQRLPLLKTKFLTTNYELLNKSETTHLMHPETHYVRTNKSIFNFYVSTLT